PPVWLRRFWRQPEEADFHHAIHDLLLYSPDRATLADRALAWAQRLVGGEAAFVLDSDASVLAAHGISVPDATALGKRSAYLKPEGKADGHAPWQAGTALVIPLDLREGRGAMILLSGRLSPMFGDDELGRLHQYAASITAGLDRVALSSKIAALERAKTDFLNIASHELRGPMTVIKGYLTMLDAGAVRNLLSNAAKYSASGTDINVEVRRDGDKACVSVSDHGVGISKQDQTQLFTRFGRIETSVHVQGTGLGLWLSKEIARMHDGDLTVESGNGAGTTFTFSVPLTQ